METKSRAIFSEFTGNEAARRPTGRDAARQERKKGDEGSFATFSHNPRRELKADQIFLFFSAVTH
jgi:hypothetical protein